MPSFCAAIGCANSSGKLLCREKKISFHKFPLDKEDILKQWIVKLKRQNFIPNEYSKVCSEHFHEDSFVLQPFTNKRIIKPDAIPSKFPFFEAEEKMKHTSDTFLDTGNSTENQVIKNHVSGTSTDVLDAKCKEDSILFEKWKKAIPRVDRGLKKKDRICELHFKSNEVERFYETTLKDGNVFKMRKGRPSLKSGAVPSIFFSTSTYPSFSKKKKSSGKKKSLDMSSVNDVPIEDEVEKVYIFTKLVQCLEDVIKPDASWTVNFVIDYIVCAQWTPHYTTQKRVIVDKNLNMKVFLKNKEIEFPYKQVCYPQCLSELLHMVDALIICEGIEFNEIECNGYLSNLQDELCTYCGGDNMADIDSQLDTAGDDTVLQSKQNLLS